MTGDAGIRDAVVVEVPETRFAYVGEDRVAYQVFGEGPPDVVYMSGATEPIDLRWDHADRGKIWVSGAVPLLMVGSNVEFEPRGEWALKGVPGDWQLLTVRT